MTLALQTNVNYFAIRGALHEGRFLSEGWNERNRADGAIFKPDNARVQYCGVGIQSEHVRRPLRNARGKFDGRN